MAGALRSKHHEHCQSCSQAECCFIVLSQNRHVGSCFLWYHHLWIHVKQSSWPTAMAVRNLDCIASPPRMPYHTYLELPVVQNYRSKLKQHYFLLFGIVFALFTNNAVSWLGVWLLGNARLPHLFFTFFGRFSTVVLGPQLTAASLVELILYRYDCMDTALCWHHRIYDMKCLCRLHPLVSLRGAPKRDWIRWDVLDEHQSPNKTQLHRK